MKNEIYVLKAHDGNLRKTYAENIEQINVGKWFVPTKHTINNLEEISDLIKDYRQKSETYCFIRGNCEITENNVWRRLKSNTLDIAKNWACLDIDCIGVEEGEEYDAESLRLRLARDIDFIEEDTAMVVDFSSSALLFRKGNNEGARPLWKAHVYVWFEEAISSKELYQRLKGYDEIDERTALVSQAIYFEEPYYDDTLYDYTLTKRTSFLSGKQASLPSSVLATRTHGRNLTTISSLSDIKARTEAFYEDATTKGKRHGGLYRLFCHVIATQQPTEYWVDRYWKDKDRSPDHDTLAKVWSVVHEAKEYIYSTYLPKLDIGRHEMIILETDNVKEAIKKKVLRKGGVIMIKSPQSTYKTQLLKKLPKDASVLLISHRTSLIRSICNELGLHIYEDNKIDLWSQDRLGITFDSLRELITITSKGEKITKREYEYVIIDESEQVISELLTTDRMEKQAKPQNTEDVFYYIGQFVKKARVVYCADADMSDITRTFLEVWRSDKFRLYDNMWNEDGKTLFLLPSLNGTIEQIYEELENDRRVFITCETKIGANTTKEQIVMAFGQEKNVLCITVDNKNKYKELLNNPNKHIPLLFNGHSEMNNGEFYGRKLDCLIVSPILTTGFSIGTLNDNENRFHTVIGIFDHYKKIYTGSDIRQAMRRVRNADTHYAYIEDAKDKWHDINEIMEFIESITPKQPNSEIIKLKQMIMRNRHISFSNRTLNTTALFDQVGWKTLKAKNETRGRLEWLLVESKIRNEERQKLINARNITDSEYEELKHKIEGAREKLKHTIKKCFYEGQIDEENTHDMPITTAMINRFQNGKIEKQHQIRDLLKGKIEELEPIWREKGDIHYEKYIKDNLQIVFDAFGFKIDEEPKEEITLFAFQIPDDKAQYLFDERNMQALNFLMKEWHDLPISKASMKLIDENKLRMFAKLACITDYDCKYVNREKFKERLKDLRKYGTETKDGKIIGKTLTHKMVKDLIKAYVKKSKDLAKRFRNDIPLKTKQLEERNCTRVDEYIKNLQIAIGKGYELQEFEMDFLKSQASHITIKSFKPSYTRFLSSFIFRYPKQDHSFKGTTKNTHHLTSSIHDEQGNIKREGIYEL